MQDTLFPPIEDEHALYPIHEEDSVPQGDAHYRQRAYLTSALELLFPQFRIVGDFCLYWEPGNMQRYVAPDVAVIGGARPEPPTNVWLKWRDPSLLFVAEVGSRLTLQQDVGPKIITYERDLGVPEYLYAYPPTGDLRLWRMSDGMYQRAEADEQGRVWSSTLGVGFGYDADGFLRVLTGTGEIFPTPPEMHEQAAEEAARRRAAEEEVAALRAELERLRSILPTDQG